MFKIHFSPEMWEKLRVDGKRILKHNAIPTIFEVISKTVASTNNEVTQSFCQTVYMGDKSNLVSNEISIGIPKEPTESVIEVTENEPNLSKT